MAWLTLTGVVPIFVTLTACELAVPTFALTDKTLGVIERDGSGSAKPAQPEVQRIAEREAIKASTRTWFFVSKLISVNLPLCPSSIFLMFYGPPGGRAARQKHRKY
jgi:hypothetical protein